MNCRSNVFLLIEPNEVFFDPFAVKRLIETANAPIFGIDADGKINEWNKKAAEFTGFSKEEVQISPSSVV